MNQLDPRALYMIETALAPIMRKGVSIERMSLVVCPESRIAKMQMVQTRFGFLVISPGEFIPKGVSYLIEDQGRIGRAFGWVSIPAKYRKIEEERKYG